MDRPPFACKCLALAFLFGLALAQLPRASAEELVKFDSTRTAENDPTLIQGHLTRPRGDGRFPSVVLLHSCLGLPANEQSITEMIAGWGYVALFVDDFTTRGIKETCAADFREGPADASGALLYLSRLPFVDPKRIAVVGYSQGADTALEIASSRFASDLNFIGAAAFYPPCENRADAKLTIPTLILIGELDNVTPAADCRRLASNQPGDSIKLVVYPGAYHLFDNASFAGGTRLLGMWLKYDAAAAEQSRSELRHFLAAEFAR
jgi:dienelactone hydrolase